jgi:VWFA-related protein
MFISTRLSYLFLASLFCAAGMPAQQAGPQAPIVDRELMMTLDVAATDKFDTPIAGLDARDFTILDNNVPETIVAFQAVDIQDAPIEVVVVIDTINANVEMVNAERIQVDRFLRANEGTLTFPVAVKVATETGLQDIANPSSDGYWVSAALREKGFGVRDIGRAGGYWGATERLQMSLKALSQIVEREAPRPGRKLVLWVSPGWPLLNEVNTALDSKQQQQVFDTIVGISTDLARAQITLYSIDPLGAGESTLRAADYAKYLKGVSKPSQVDTGDLGLQVIAIQSGGLALNSGNDVTKFLQECVADAAPYYQISFGTTPAQRPNEYHHFEVKVAKPGLTARTRQGFYKQPQSAPAPGS